MNILTILSFSIRDIGISLHLFISFKKTLKTVYSKIVIYMSNGKETQLC